MLLPIGMRQLTAILGLALGVPAVALTSAPTTGGTTQLTITPADFVVLSQPTQARWTLAPQTGRARLEGQGSVDLLAPVHPPAGARVERMVCYFEDSDPKANLEVHAELYRSRLDGDDFELVTAVNEDTRGAPGRIKDEARGLPAKLSGSLHRYHLHLYYRQTAEPTQPGALAFDGCHLTLVSP